MELKKSISDTERSLKSYGSVSETEWTKDKGEHHSLQSNVLACYNSYCSVQNKACGFR